MDLLTSFNRLYFINDYKVEGLSDEQRKLSLVESCNKANISLGLIEYDLNGLLGASHRDTEYSVHIRFDLERYLLIIRLPWSRCSGHKKKTRGLYGHNDSCVSRRLIAVLGFLHTIHFRIQ